MTKTRSIFAGLAVAALVAVPSVAVASGSGSAAPAGTPAHRSTVHFLAFDHVRSAGQALTVRGQVIGSRGGHHGALAGVTVTLTRRLDGNTAWTTQGTATTTTTATPTFSFHVVPKQNARYRVAFAGDSTFAASSATTWLEVYRLFHPVITGGTASATLHGSLSPYGAGKVIDLQKATCSTCVYQTVKTARGGTGGAYSFSLGAPAHGLWYWRLTVAGTVAFISSYSSTYSTQLH